MPYSGRPSKGCARCRSKRTKCGLEQPSCRQCLKNKIVCSGYRDEVSIVFRDQTHHVLQKHHAVHGAGVDQSRHYALPELTHDEKSQTAAKTTESAEIKLPSTLALPIEDQATCFFIRHHVWEGESVQPGSWDYLPDYCRGQRQGSAVMESIVALGILGLANKGRVEVPSLARSKYIYVLRFVNEALRDPIRAKSDETMICVNLLSLYESTNCRSAPSMKAWAKHVDGSIALLRLRGTDQFKSYLGRRLFIQARAQIVISCVHRKIHTPDFVEAWSELANDRNNQRHDHVKRVLNIYVRFCNLQAFLHENPSESNQKTLEELDTMNDDLYSWVAGCPPGYEYETRTIGQTSEYVLGSKYHVYYDRWAAIVWNHYRGLHMLVNGLIFDHCQQFAGSEPDSASYWLGRTNSALASLRGLSLDTCASVPYYLGYHTCKTSAKERLRMSGACANLLLWPLYGAAAANLFDPEVLRWITDRLEQITEDTGIMQGKALAEVLKQQRKVATADMNGTD